MVTEVRGTAISRRWPATPTKVLALTLVLLIVGFFLIQSVLDPDPRGREVSTAEFDQLGQQGRLETLVVHDEDSLATGTYTIQSGSDHYWLAYPNSEAAVQVLVQTAADSGA